MVLEPEDSLQVLNHRVLLLDETGVEKGTDGGMDHVLRDTRRGLLQQELPAAVHHKPDHLNRKPVKPIGACRL